MRVKHIAAIAAAVSSLSMSSSVFAVARTWVATTASFFETPANWSPTGIPLVGDDIIFNSAATVNFDSVTGNRTVQTLTSNNNFTQTLRNPFATAIPVLTVTNGITLSGVNTFNIGASTQLPAAHVDLTTNTFTTNKTTNVSYYSTLTATTLNVATTANASVIAFQSGNVSTGSASFGSNGFTGTLSLTTNGTLTAAGTSAFGLSGGTGVLTMTGASVYNAFILRISNGGTAIADISDAGTQLNASSQLVLGATSGFGGTLRVKNQASVTAASVTLNEASSLEVLGGTFTTPFLQNSGSITLNSGTMNISRIGDSMIGANNFNFVRGTVNLTSIGTYSNVYGDEFSIAPLFGNGPQSITPGKTISAAAISLSETLSLDGGTLRVGQIFSNGLLQLNSGVLEMDGTTLTVGTNSSGLGSLVDVKPGVTLRATGTQNAFVNTSSLLSVRDGGTFEGNSFNNTGEIILNGPLARVVARSGTFTNSGEIGGSGRIESSGFVNTGQVYLNEQGRLKFVGNVTNNATGRISGRGTLDTLSLTNLGRVELSAGFTDVLGIVNNNSGGRIIVSGGAVASFFGAVTNGSGAEIRTSAGARSAFYAPVNGSGSFTGTGVVQFENTYSPGSSPGLISFGGDVELTDASVLQIELGGATRGSGYDALDIASHVDIAGDLSLAAIGGYVPAYLVSHRVIDAASRSGQFSSIDGVFLTATRALAVTYNASGDVFVTAAIPGDADLNGTVDFSDLLTLAQNYSGTSKSWSTGDFSGDGSTEFADLLTLAQNYGNSVSLTGGIELDDLLQSRFDADWQRALAIVPEPASACVALAAGFMVRRRRTH